MTGWRFTLAAAASSVLTLVVTVQGCGFVGAGSFDPAASAQEGGDGSSSSEGGVPPPDCAASGTCDGSTSCTCVAAPAGGWMPVAVLSTNAASDGGLGGDAGGAGVTCPAGWTSPRTLRQAPRAPGTTCDCACGAGPNPCTYGTMAASFRTGSAYCNDGSATVMVDGACHPLGVAWNTSYNGAGGYAPAVQNAACPAAAVLSPIIDDGSTVVCSLAAGGPPCAGGTCASPDVAIKKLCALHDGDLACPAELPAKQLVSPHDAIVDGRSCEACTCKTTATTCANTTLTFASNATCTAGLRSVPISGFCESLSGSGTPSFYVYKATPDTTACTPDAATVPSSGAVTTPTATLCCPP